MRLSSLVFVFPFAAAIALAAPSAHAEPTSWLSLGGGYGLEHNGVTHANDGAGAVSFSVGAGTPATHPVVVGGIFRTIGYVGLGTDISLSVRLAMQSFCVGDWGLALDVGVGGRFWSNGAYGEWPLQASIVGGLPFGFQLAVGADAFDVGDQKPTARGGFAVFELDFLRLTAMRSGATTHTWPNPSPVNGPLGPTTP